VAKVGHRTLTESTLGLLEEVAVFLELGEDQLDMMKVLCPRGVVDQYVIKRKQARSSVEKDVELHSLGLGIWPTRLSSRMASRGTQRAPGECGMSFYRCHRGA
jgi:hypothetical protein